MDAGVAERAQPIQPGPIVGIDIGDIGIAALGDETRAG
jgi:hypothetical protein